MSGVFGGGGQGGGGGGMQGPPGATGGGLCVFSCSTFLSALGAIAALLDYDLGPESAFFTVNGLGALCFAKCQYLRLAEEKSRANVNRKQHESRNDFDPSYNHITQYESGYASNGIRKRRDDKVWYDYSQSQNTSSILDKPNRKGNKVKGKKGKSSTRTGTIS